MDLLLLLLNLLVTALAPTHNGVVFTGQHDHCGPGVVDALRSDAAGSVAVLQVEVTPLCTDDVLAQLTDAYVSVNGSRN